MTAFAARLSVDDFDGLPVYRVESVLVHLAATPTAVVGWGPILDVLGDLLDRCDVERVVEEVTGRPHATLVRLAYLCGYRHRDLVARLRVEPRGVVWFGPRGQVLRSESRWNLVDTVLPRRPGVL